MYVEIMIAMTAYVRYPPVCVQHVVWSRAGHAPAVSMLCESHKLHTSAAATKSVRDLTTQAEIDDALRASRVTGRLAVIKFHSPACALCIASAPKFRRLAMREASVHDFYQVRPRLPPNQPAARVAPWSLCSLTLARRLTRRAARPWPRRVAS